MTRDNKLLRLWPHRPVPTRWLLVAGLAVAVRLAVLLLAPSGLAIDTDGYLTLADHLNEYGVYGTGTEPTAYRPPLYVLLLSVVRWLPLTAPVAIGTLHLVLGLLTIYVVFRLARDRHSGMAALVAPILVTLDPILLHHSAQVMSETLATCCAALCLACLTRADRQGALLVMALAGATLGVSSLCRPNFLAWLIMVAAYLVWTSTRREEQWPWIIALVGACGLALAPWALRNALLLDRPVITTTHGGYTFLLGNNPSFYTYLRKRDWGESWNPNGIIPSRDRASGELDYDRACYQRAWRSIQDEPGMAAWSALVKAGRLWSPLPYRRSVDESIASRVARYATAGWYSIVFALVIWGVWSQRLCIGKSPWVWVVLMCLAWTAVHAFYWSNLRMRAPLVPGLALLAAAGVASLLKSWKNISQRHSV